MLHNSSSRHIISRLYCNAFSWPSCMSIQTSPNDPEYSGTFGLQWTQETGHYASLCLTPLAASCCPHQVQGTETCPQKSHCICTLLTMLTSENVHYLQKSAVSTSVTHRVSSTYLYTTQILPAFLPQFEVWTCWRYLPIVTVCLQILGSHSSIIK